MAVIKNEFRIKSDSFFTKHEKEVKLIAFLLFIGLTFIIGIFHEPWTDEAQSWLIARDTNLDELFKVMAYEGSPVLWPIILKIFIFFGLPYRYLFIVPFLFSAIGVLLLIYKSKLPLILSVILPYTYYIFYQYAAIARSYCLVLPCIELIVLAFPKRLHNPFNYGLLLILLSGISLHTALLSGVLYILFCIDISKYLKQFTNKLQIVNAISAACVVLLSYLITVRNIWPPADYSFPAHFIISMKSIYNFSDLFGNLLIYNAKTVVNIIILVLAIFIFLLFFKISIRFILISSVIWIFLSLFYHNQWHSGIIFLSFLLAFQIYQPKLRKFPLFIVKLKPMLIAIIIVIFMIQIFWSVKTAAYDISNPYSGAFKAAQFIKVNHYDQQRIYGLGYNATALEPYFDKNIYQNKGENKAYYYWSKNNGDLTTDQILDNLPPIVVLADFNKGEFPGVEDDLVSLNYQVFEFNGASYIKNNIYESQKYLIYVRKDLVKDTVQP